MNKALKATLAVVAGSVAVAGSVVTPSLVSAWGDSNKGRDTYTIDQINNGDLGDKIVFNSIVDPKGALSDERNFVGARENTGVNAGANNVWEGNDIKVENGKEYLIRLYVHNNNPGGKDAVSHNTRVAFNVPTTTAKQVTVNGYIYSDNADPREYWDYVNFYSDNAFHLEYVYGSALLENNGIGANGGVKLGDEIVTQAESHGVQIGYESLNGEVPGCYEYDNFVGIRVKAVFDTDYYVDKEVRLEGTKEWSNYVNAKVGDRVEFQMEYKNTSTKNEDQYDVMLKDILPKNLRYVPGSTKIWNEEFNGAQLIPDGDIVGTGVNLGHYKPGANAFVRFTAEVIDEDLTCGSNTLVNWAQVTVGSLVAQDYASVILNKVCENTPTPTTNTPNQLPTTGPEAIAGGVIATGSVVTAAGYYIASRRSLH